MTEPTTFEGMIGRALLGDNAEKELQLIRIDCKHYAMQKIFCECGAILDQRRTNILRDRNGKDRAVCCDACRDKAIEALQNVADTTDREKQILKGWTFSNWNGRTPVLRKNEE
jgi:hypothetical protein